MKALLAVVFLLLVVVVVLSVVWARVGSQRKGFNSLGVRRS